MRRALQQFVTFEALDPETGAPLPSLTFADGDVKLKKDDGAFVDIAGARIVNAGNGVYLVELTAAETNAVWIVLIARQAGMAPTGISGSTTGDPVGAVVDDPANSATTFKTDLTEAGADFWKHAGLVFRDGALRHQVREITGFDTSTKFITLATPLTDEPVAGALFALING